MPVDEFWNPDPTGIKDVAPPNWIETDLLPGYLISRSNIVLSGDGAKNGCPEPALGRNEKGELSFWIKPIGYPASIRLRIEGLRNFFK